VHILSTLIPHWLNRAFASLKRIITI